MARLSAEDVHHIRLAQACEDAGIELDVIARGIGAGTVSYAVARHQPCRSRRVSERGGPHRCSSGA
jgi:hypothetical protein